MPLYEFEEFLALDKSKIQQNPQNLINYWGYTVGNYFAPKASFWGENNPGAMECILEFFFPEKINPHIIIDALRYWRKEYHVDGFRIIGNPSGAQLLAQDELLCGCKLFFDGFSTSNPFFIGHPQTGQRPIS